MGYAEGSMIASDAPPRAGDAAWFLDIDGTLLDLAPTPDGVRVDGALTGMLLQLFDASGGALALISGRSVSAVDRLFGEVRLPVAGQHGVERRDADGSIHHHPASAQRLAAARHVLRLWAAERPPLLLEDKGLSLALHYRAAPQMAEEVESFAAAMVAASGGELCLQPGKMVVEIKPAGRDKGVAICEFMEEAPFRGRLPVFVGDDASDEFGFAMVNRLGGLSVKVGGGPTAAIARLPDVTAVREWLAAAGNRR